jgi:predicted amidohydrolase
MKIGYMQFEPVLGEKKKNLKKIFNFLEIGAQKEADLLVLPELCNVGYNFESMKEVREISEGIPEGTTTRKLSKFTKENGLYIVAGISEREGEKCYNSSVLVGPEGFIARYRKAHLFNKEKLWFSPGRTQFKVYDIHKARIGVMICFDWFFPEVIRILSLKKAQIVCHPSNLVLPYCQTALLGPAIQNKIFIITANRIGVERGLQFTGMSQIISPDMKIIARSRKFDEEIKIVDIDPREADSKMITKQNNIFKDRRTDLYEYLVEVNK